MTAVPLSAKGFIAFIAPSPDLTGAAGAAGVAGTISGLAAPPPAGATVGPLGAPPGPGALTGVSVGPAGGVVVRCEPTTPRTSLITRACSRGDLSMVR